MLDSLKRLLGVAQEPLEVAAYGRLRSQGFAPDLIIDVGAYEGHWTRMARSVFGPVPTIMVEAQAGKAALLEQVCRELPGVSLVSALLADTSGVETTFYEMETGSSMRAENSNVARTESRIVTRTLDEVVGDAGGSIFLKIDVQGAELDVLGGGQGVLARCGAVQLETALLPYNAGAPLMTEVLVKMESWGFVPHDFAGFVRPGGVDLVQTDVIFVPRGSPLRKTFFQF